MTSDKGPDWLDGGAGDDTLYSGRASDKQVDGGDGNDRIFTDRGNDPASGGPGADYIDGGLEGIESQEILSFVENAHALDMMRDPVIDGGQGFLLGLPDPDPTKVHLPPGCKPLSRMD